MESPNEKNKAGCRGIERWGGGRQQLGEGTIDRHSHLVGVGGG